MSEELKVLQNQPVGSSATPLPQPTKRQIIKYTKSKPHKPENHPTSSYSMSNSKHPVKIVSTAPSISSEIPSRPKINPVERHSQPSKKQFSPLKLKTRQKIFSPIKSNRNSTFDAAGRFSLSTFNNPPKPGHSSQPRNTIRTAIPRNKASKQAPSQITPKEVKFIDNHPSVNEDSISLSFEFTLSKPVDQCKSIESSEKLRSKSIYDPRLQRQRIFETSEIFSESFETARSTTPYTLKTATVSTTPEFLSVLPSPKVMKQQELSTLSSECQSPNKARILDFSLRFSQNALNELEIKEILRGFHLVSLSLNIDAAQGVGYIKIRSNLDSDAQNLITRFSEHSIQAEPVTRSFGKRSDFTQEFCPRTSRTSSEEISPARQMKLNSLRSSIFS